MNATPSPDQVRQLSALVPLQRNPAPKTLHLLNQLLDICRTDWICDFLFDTEPNHIPWLTSPTLLTSAITCDDATTRAEATSLQPDPANMYAEMQHLTSRYLFVPVFTADKKTFGFGVMDGAESRGLPSMPGDFNISLQHLYNFRFVRDARTRTLLIVNDAPAYDCIVVYYSRVVSTTAVHSFTARFKRSLLLELLLKEHGSLIIKKILPALIYILEEHKYRSCLRCNSDHHEGCLCVIPLAEPKNPFDFRHFKTGLLQDFGISEGMANKVVNKNGHQVRHSVFGVRSLRQGINDLALVRRLSKWSVSNHLNRTPEDPRQSVSFGMYAGSLIEDVAGSSKQVNGNTENEMGLVNGSDMVSPDFNVLPSLFAALRNNQLDSNPIQQARNHEEHVCFNSEPRSSDEHVIPCGVGAMGEVDTAQAGNTTEALDVIGDWELEDEGGAVEPAPRKPDRRRRRRRDDSNDIIASLRRMEAEKTRRENNRKSAHRCNVKNRLTKERLKAELKNATEKEESLREREMMLRKQNLELRGAVNRLPRKQ